MPGVASVIGASSGTDVSSAAGTSVVAGGSPGKRNPLRSRGARPSGSGTAMRYQRRAKRCRVGQPSWWRAWRKGQVCIIVHGMRLPVAQSVRSL